MAQTAHPTTVRLSDQEQTFLASLKIAGATTTSDKIRALIHDKQRQQSASGDYASALDAAQTLMGPAQQQLKLAEKHAGIQSQLVRRLLDWSPELIATLLHDSPSSDSDVNTDTSIQQLVAFEANLTRDITQLLDIVIQSYISRDTALYRADSLDKDTLKPLGRLCQLVVNDLTQQK